MHTHPLYLVLYIIAAAAFLLAALNVQSRVNLVALGYLRGFWCH